MCNFFSKSEKKTILGEKSKSVNSILILRIVKSLFVMHTFSRVNLADYIAWSYKDEGAY